MEKLIRWMVKRWMPDYYLAHKPRKKLNNEQIQDALMRQRQFVGNYAKGALSQVAAGWPGWKVEGIPDLGQPGGVKNGE
uniref:Uncharacterized protein n=1 Tax=viral metagenome TaxID=1070528 RepID=A0A6M3LRF7_9ZZZZ